MNDIAPPVAQGALHPETDKLIAAFSDALRAKLAAAEQKYGFNDDWRTDEWEEACQRDLASHVLKGDPLDVAAYAAFCWARGWRTSGGPVIAQQERYSAFQSTIEPDRWYVGTDRVALLATEIGASGEQEARLVALLLNQVHSCQQAGAVPAGYTHPENVAEVAACVDLVRRMAANSSIGRPFADGEVIKYSSAHYEEARTICGMSVTTAPTPRDAGLGEILHIAREAAASVFDADEQHCIAADIRAGRQDHMSQVQAAVAALTRKASAETPPDTWIDSAEGKQA